MVLTIPVLSKGKYTFLVCCRQVLCLLTCVKLLLMSVVLCYNPLKWSGSWNCSFKVFVFLLVAASCCCLLTECHRSCFLSCSVPSISVQLNGSTSVSSALAGKRVTDHPSWLLLQSCTTRLSFLQVFIRMMFVVYVPFFLFICRVSVGLFRKSRWLKIKKDTP